MFPLTRLSSVSTALARGSPSAVASRSSPALLVQPHAALLQQTRWKRGKRKKRPRLADRDPGLADMKVVQADGKTHGVTYTRLEDRVDRGRESPYSIAKNISSYLNRLTADAGKQFHYRRSKDFTYRHRHRMLRFAGLTHDFADEVIVP